MLIFSAMLVSEGEEDKFRRLYEKYSPLVYWIAVRKLKSKEKAEDCLQETFLYIAGNMDKIGKVSAKETKGYIAAVAEGKAISLFRKETLRESGNIVDLEMQPDIITVSAYDKVDVGLMLESLDEQTRNMVILKYLYGYTAKEIGEFYGISSDLVRKRLQKGLEKLRC